MMASFLPPCMIFSHKQRIYYSHRSSNFSTKARRDIRWGCICRRKALPCSNVVRRSMHGASPRVFVLSDLHTDYPENMSWVKHLSTEGYRGDILLVAGDVAETCKNFVLTMSELKMRFHSVFYVPGNHDLWCRRGRENHINSIDKMDALLDACQILGIETSPKLVDNLAIIPLFSWYHESFDKEKDINGIRIPSLDMACKDFLACKWPHGLSSKDVSLALYFDALNEKNHDVIEELRKSFQSYVLRRECYFIRISRRL